MTLYVDTSAWYAVIDADDASHSRAAATLSSGERLLTSDHVVVETWWLLRRRLGWRVAERFWTGLGPSGVEVETVRATDLERARAIGEAFLDQDLSIVDRTSFAVLQRLRLDRVAAFDHHFAIYRYGPARDRALTVVR